MIYYSIFLLLSIVTLSILLFFLIKSAKDYKHRKALKPLFLLKSPMIALLMLFIFFWHIPLYQDFLEILTLNYKVYHGKIEQGSSFFVKIPDKTLLLDWGMKDVQTEKEGVELFYLPHTGIVLEFNHKTSWFFDWLKSFKPQKEALEIPKEE